MKENTVQQFIPYLSFDGNCKEAMQFYHKTFGGNIVAMMHFADTPMGAQLPTEIAQRVMHAYLALDDGSALYGGDAPTHEPFRGQIGVTITMSYQTVAQAQQVFEALSAGGKITMPLAPSFWAKIFGMVTDRFGTSWAINGEQLAVDRVD